MPKLEDNKDRLEAIGGMVPAAHNFPVGCRFASRCEYATAVCTDAMPDLVQASDKRNVRCFLYEEGSTTPDRSRISERVIG